MRDFVSIIIGHKKTLLFTYICLSISLALILLSRYAEGFAQWYAVKIYPVFPNIAGRIFSIWEYSFFEAAILSALIFSVIFAAMISWYIFSRHPLRKNFFYASLRSLTCITAGLVLLYSLTGSVNYHRDGIGTVLKLPEGAVTKENLVKLSFILADELNALTSDPDWDYSLLTMYDRAQIETEAVNAMKFLGKREPTLSGYYPQPKPVYFSGLMSEFGIEGIFSPFTLEANYNASITPFLIPYTLCHELAHLKGYMKEDDAGYIAYLASTNSPSLVFQYSGFFRALVFTLNALIVEAGAAEYYAVYQKLEEPIRFQLNYIKQQNKQRSPSSVSVAKKVNNAYLKVNSQSGTISYGRIVELLLADHAEKINGKNLF